MTIYLPNFPILDPTRPLELAGEHNDSPDPAAPSSSQPQPGDHIDLGNGMGILPANLPENNDDDLLSDDDDDDSSDDGDGDNDVQQQQQLLNAENRARQFGEDSARVLGVAHPALHPELNLHVWEAAGKAMPLIRSVAVATAADVAVVEEDGDGGGEAMGDDGVEVPGEGDDDVMMGDAESEADGEEEEEAYDDENEEGQPKVDGRLKKASPEPPPEIIAHPGAGTSVIAGSGSSLNHVVAVEWSPAGLGRNLRPVLAVLTACGSLAVYGEGGLLPFGSTAKPSRTLGPGNRVVRDLQSWLALWAVGENFVLPGQEEYGYGEFVKAFAWSGEVGKGKSLLGYMNDLREIVVLCVGTTFQKTVEGLDEVVWNVQEVARMVTSGPHAFIDVSIFIYIHGVKRSETDIIYSPMIQTMSLLDPATAFDGAPGPRAKRPGLACCPTRIRTTSVSRSSPSMRLHGILERLPSSPTKP